MTRAFRRDLRVGDRGDGARRSRAQRGEPGAAVRVRSCEATGEHKVRRDRLPNLHRRCYKRFRLEQRETPLAGRFGGCGTGTRTPTSGARIRRPTIRRSRRASAGLYPARGRRQISSRYSGTRRFSSSVSMCAITSTYGSSPEPRSFALQQPVDLEEAGRVVHHDLDAHGLRLAVADHDLLDRRRRERVHRDLAALERDARAALRHVERVGDAEDARLERERLAVGAVARDRLQHLGDDHGAVGLVVDARRAARAASARRGRGSSPRGPRGAPTSRRSG